MTVHADEVEEQVLGAMLRGPEAVGVAAAALNAQDFYRPSHAALFAYLVEDHGMGRPLDMRSLAARVRGDGHDVQDAALVGMLANGALISRLPSMCQVVGEYATRRRLSAECARYADAAVDLTVDLGELISEARQTMGEVDTPKQTVPEDLWGIDDFLDRPHKERAQWVVPGLFREGWRVMAVAPEGMGKTWVFRQIAMCAAQGIHPFSFDPIPPVTTLLVDLENPEDHIDVGCNVLRVQTRRVASDRYRDNATYLWHRPGGLDLRSRRDRGDLEAVIQHCRPQLVSLGPVYKSYRVGARENDELAAGDVMALLDNLRTRYEFALLLEHHAPKKQGGVRELQPYGSSLWLRWPELGLKLIPPSEDETHELKVARWRGDRLENSWPDVLQRSNPWPWTGVWNNGIPREYAA